jgi:hypothetical protein
MVARAAERPNPKGRTGTIPTILARWCPGTKPWRSAAGSMLGRASTACCRKAWKSGCLPRRSGRRPHAAPMDASFRGAITNPDTPTSTIRMKMQRPLPSRPDHGSGPLSAGRLALRSNGYGWQCLGMALVRVRQPGRRPVARRGRALVSRRLLVLRSKLHALRLPRGHRILRPLLHRRLSGGLWRPHPL